MKYYIIHKAPLMINVTCETISRETYQKRLDYTRNRGKVTKVFAGGVRFILCSNHNQKTILIDEENFNKIENKKNFEIFLANS